MKEIWLKNGRGKIVTPWLRIDEAAAYCGISRSAFEAKTLGVPHGGDSRTRLYHHKVLDSWMEGAIDGVPFTREKVGPRRAPVRVTVAASHDEQVIIDPGTGKVW